MLHLQTYADNQCCYLYGSVPTNNSVCVIDGRTLGLTCYVYNPHIPFTDLTVRWFRSTEETREVSSIEELIACQYCYSESSGATVLQGLTIKLRIVLTVHCIETVSH